MKKYRIEWITLFVGLIWFFGAGYVFISYLGGTLGDFAVPRIVGWIYDLFGIIPGTIVQWIFSIILIVRSFRKNHYTEIQNYDNEDDDDDDEE